MLEFFKNFFFVLVSVLTPIHGILAVICFLILADLVLGILAALKRGEKIRSGMMRRTVSKLLAYQLGIICGFLVETFLIGGAIPMVKIIAALIGMVEMKSILENADSINGESIFKSLITKIGSDNEDKPQK